MLVSIIIPTYNRAGKLLRAVDSVLRQSYKDIELIVVDDGSTDDTEFWIQKYRDARLKYFKVPPLPNPLPRGERGFLGISGVARARNYGVKVARAEWVCFLDSDDLWRRHKLSEQLRFHDQHRDILISQTDDVWIRSSKRVNKKKIHQIREGHIFEDSLRLCLICCSSVMIQRKLFNDLGGFDEELVTCEDYDLWLRVLANNPVGFIKKELVTKFGGHEDQLSKKYPMMDKYRVYALEKLLKSEMLNTCQMDFVYKEISYKRAILENGAKKRIL